MDRNDQAYYLQRARVELECVERAINPAVAMLHQQLRELYLAKAAELIDGQPVLRVVASPAPSP